MLLDQIDYNQIIRVKIQKYPWVSVNFFLLIIKDNLVILMCFLKVKINKIP